MSERKIAISKSMLKDFAKKNQIIGQLEMLESLKPILLRSSYQRKVDSLTKKLIALDEKYSKKEQTDVRATVIVIRG